MIDRGSQLSPSLPGRVAGLLAGLTLLMALGGQSMADPIIEIVPANLNVAPGSTGVLDVLLDNSDGSVATLSSFSVTLDTPVGSGITFTGADTDNTGYPYVFENDDSAGFTSSNPNGLNTANIFDYANDLNQQISAGIYGLGEIFFSVDPAAIPGQVPVTVDSSSSLTGGPGMSGSDFFNISYATSNATITIPQLVPPSVPEPTSLTMAAIGCTLTAMIGLRNRRRGASLPASTMT